jgi:hypothetical protein
MAGLDERPSEWTTPRHDGLAVCRMCTSSDPDAGHAWCPAIGALVCDGCCHEALIGEDSRLFAAAAAAAERADAAEDLATSCIECERGQRWFADRIRERIARGPAPC